VPDAPDQLDLRRHRDEPPGAGIWIRRAFLTLFLVFALLGLLNAFGQVPSVSRAGGPAASLKVSAPTRLRGGLLFQARFDIHANRKLDHPTLVLGPGWVEGMTINTIEPSPSAEASRSGRLVLRLEPAQRGEDVTLWMDFQVNPTTVGRRAQDVDLDDGTQQLVRIQRTVTVFP
jgi:hypothetical protein